MGSMRKSRLSQHKLGCLIEHFAARTMARICGVQCNTAAYYSLRLREIIAYKLEAEGEAMFGGDAEMNENYFGGKRKGKRGWGAAGKISVFGLFKRSKKVYNKIIPDASGVTLIPIIERMLVVAIRCQMCLTAITSVLTCAPKTPPNLYRARPTKGRTNEGTIYRRTDHRDDQRAEIW